MRSRGDARALRRDRGQLARGDRPALLHLRDAALHRPRGRGAGERSRRAPLARPVALAAAGSRRSTASPTPTAPGPDAGATSSSTASAGCRPTTAVTVEPDWSCSSETTSARRSRRRSTPGGIVVVTGEAGIGKTELVRAVAPADALWGVCDPLITPRPLGPWHDIARRVAAARRGAGERLARGGPERDAGRARALHPGDRGPALGRRRDARSRRAGRAPGGRRRVDPDHAPGRADRGAAGAGGAARRAGASRARSARPRSRSSPRRPAATRATCTRSPAATRSSSPRRSRAARRSRCGSAR